jgi:rRNA processing protein Gar1
VKISTATLAFLVASVPLSAAPALAQAPSAAPAASAATPAAGVKVYDTAGAEVGTIKSVNAPNFVIDTGKNTATLALTSLGTGPQGPTIGMTREQLDAAVEKASADAAASLSAAIVADAPVHASDKTTVLGKVSEVTETEFVLDTGTAKVKLPKTSVAKGDNGLFIGMTAQAFADATKAAAPAASK